jgi:hypothetical protein
MVKIVADAIGILIKKTLAKIKSVIVKKINLMIKLILKPFMKAEEL